MDEMDLSPMVGKTISDYKIVAEIGRGGRGVVYAQMFVLCSGGPT